MLLRSWSSVDVSPLSLDIVDVTSDEDIKINTLNISNLGTKVYWKWNHPSKVIVIINSARVNIWSLSVTPLHFVDKTVPPSESRLGCLMPNYVSTRNIHTYTEHNASNDFLLSICSDIK